MQQKIGRDIPRPASVHVVAASPSVSTPSSHVSRSVNRSDATPTAVNGNDAASERVKRTPRPRRFQGSPPAPGECGGSFDDCDDVTSQQHDRHSSDVAYNDEGMDKFFSRCQMLYLTNKH